MQATVDVLALSYNHEKYLSSFFESLIKQTYRPLRLVLVNDCSPDNSNVVIESYRNALYEACIEFVYIYHTKNTGFFDAFDTARQYIESKYIATLETDDYFEPTKIEESVGFLEANPQFALCHTDINSLWEDGRYEEHSWKKMGINQLGIETPYEYLLADNRCYTATTVVRSEIFLQSPKDEEWKKRGYRMGDYPRVLWIGKRHKIGYIDKNLSTYRIHHKSASHNPETYAAFVASYQQIKQDAREGLI